VSTSKLIYVVEPICGGLEHVPFNAAILKILLLAYPQDNLLFFGEKTHIEALQGELGPTQDGHRITFIGRAISPRKTTDARRTAYDYWLVRHVVARTNPQNVRQLVFLSVSNGILRLVHHLDRRLGKTPQLVAFLHGGVKKIRSRRGRSPISRFFDTGRSLASATRNPRFRCFVLENSIKPAVLRIAPELENSIRVLEHPLPSVDFIAKRYSMSSPLKFAYLGLASVSKGFPLFCCLASAIRDSGFQATFYCIGSAPDLNLRCLATDLTMKPSPAKLGRADYLRHLSQVDYCVFPYRSDDYELTASGALLDALAMEKPFIATDTPIFNNLFDRFGSMGYLVKDGSDWIEQLTEIIKHHSAKQYLDQVQAVKRASESRVESVLASQYRSACDS